MKKNLLALVVCCVFFLGGTVFANPISPEQAKEIAVEWMEQIEEEQVEMNESTTMSVVSTEEILKAGETIGYLVSFSEGYVIVNNSSSSSSVYSPVKAWSKKGIFDGPIREMVYSSLSTGRENNEEYFFSDSDSGAAAAFEEKENDFPLFIVSESIGPLIHTRWGQDYPYNEKCPYDYEVGDRSITGCVATAMAQLMRYWEWPEIGSGYKCYYQRNGEERCADFEHSYNWESMPNELSDNSDPWEIDQISQLIYDVGVLANTAYHSSVSWGFYAPLCSGMKYYMLYNCNSTAAGEMDLFECVQSDIYEDEPVFLGGNHAFICDGYLIGEYLSQSSSYGSNCQKIKQLHFNFGWDGLYDGWYTIDEFDYFDFLEGKTKYYYVIKDIHPIKYQPAGAVASRFPPKAEKNVIEIPAKEILFSPELIIPDQDMGKEVQPVMWLYTNEYNIGCFWDKYVTLLEKSYSFSKFIDFGSLKGELVNVYIGYIILNNEKTSGVMKYFRYQLTIE